MKKLATFTLVRKSKFGTQVPTRGKARSGVAAGTDSNVRPKTGSAGQTVQNYARAEQSVLSSVKKSPELANVFVKLDRQFKTALINSYVTTVPKKGRSGSRAKPSVNSGMLSITRELARSAKVRRVGLLDMGAWIGGLPTLVERLNEAQPLFTIFEIQAPIPGGLITQGSLEWSTEHFDFIRVLSTFLSPHLATTE